MAVVSQSDPAASSRLGYPVDELRYRRELARLGHPRRVTKGMSPTEQLELIRVTYKRLMAAPLRTS